jgi:adenylate cyclase
LGTAALGVILLPLMPVLEESWGLWTLFNLRGTVAPPDEVVVVGIDEGSANALNGPLKRSMHATFVDTLVEAGASVIIFDLFLHTESLDDDAFATAIDNARNVVLTARVERDSPAGMDRQTLRRPIRAFADRAIGTAPWLVPEAFRVDWVLLRDDADRPTIPLVALQAYAFDDFMALLRAARPDVGARFPSTKAEILPGRPLESIMAELARVFANDSSLGVDMLANGTAAKPGLRSLISMYDGDEPYRANRLFLNYYGVPRTVATVPYQTAFAAQADTPSVAGKAVFVGYSAQGQPGQQDDYPYVYSTNGFNLSGVEMGATAFANLLHDNYLRSPAPSVRMLLLFAWGLLIAVAFDRLREPRLGLVAGALLFGGYLLGAVLAFRSGNIWLPIVVPAVQLLFAGTMSVRVKQLVERAQLEIGTSEEAALALTGRGKPEKVDHRVILFADEQGSKKRLRRELTELDAAQRRALQRDFAMARDVPVTANGGRINHTLADSMLAHWVTPDSTDAAASDKHLNAACRAALAIHERIGELNRKYPGFELSLRIGLDWGEVSSRLNPSPEIKDWKMDGTPIHSAERLESLNKVFGTSSLVSHTVAERLDANEFHCHELGTFVFRDDSGDIVVDPVRVHELRAARNVTEADRRQAAQFDAALKLLRQRDWGEALARFEELASSGRKHSELASRYVVWCRQTQEEAESRWRGVVAVTFSDKSQYLDRFL